MFSVVYKTLVILIIHFYRTSETVCVMANKKKTNRRHFIDSPLPHQEYALSYICVLQMLILPPFLWFSDYLTVELLWPCGMSFFVILSVGASTSHEWRRWSKPQSKWWWTLTALYCVNPNTLSAIMTSDQVFW